ncbi:MAG: glycosyltransferase [Nitrospina sp.]|jgi:glycosyltransferase involved in cell wall biosynthesis|nr:glycosyltransferase [Nitrospina sp.]MBT3510715.1 glycosyltransferase [Nitrospina sp.]MBT3875984.1 glycosyltransferase [Nitrospina sp.]MBT4048973.1 glycosyltransferase [Nitrospina sp.]MBT4557651.1 glycosyltransferase [Nitrospina sp.]
MSKPLVSIIIPTFNRGYCLAESICSVLDQSFTNLELIVVDDGSTDNTLEIVRKFPGTQMICLEKNRGVSFARNRGLEQARGDWIAFLDSDDLWEKGKLEAQIKWIEKHPDCQAVYTDEVWIRNGVRVNPMNKHRKYSRDIFPYCLPLCIVSPSSVLLRAQLLRELGGFDESMPVCEDYDLWLRIAKHYPFHFIEEKLIVKRGGHEDQLSRKYWGMDRWRVYALEKLLKENQLKEEQRDGVVAMLIEKCRVLVIGYDKRGKSQDAEHYRTLAARYSGLAEVPLK